MSEPETQRAKRLMRDKKLWEKWLEDGIPCSFVSFHDPVPTARDKEPVGEFRLETTDKKYRVDRMTYTPFGLFFLAHNEWSVAGLANVKLIRFNT